MCVVGVAAAGAGQPPATTGAVPGDLAARFAALQQPVIVGRVEAPGVVVVGRARITPAAGTAVYVFAADGTRCGLLVDGPASLTYRVEDPFSVPVARRNLKRVGGLSVTEAGGVLTIAGSLRGAAIWGWNLEVGAVSPRTGVTLPD